MPLSSRPTALMALLLAFLLAACGGGGGNTSPATVTLGGVAATGAGIAGVVTLKDLASGQLQATHTDDGSYTFNVTGLAGPFLLRVRPDDGGPALYGLALAGGSGRGHLNPLTHRVVLRLAAGLSPAPADLATLFDDPAALRGLAATDLDAARAWVLAHTSPYFRARLQARGVDLASLDPLAGPFRIGQGLDLAFDEVRFFHDEPSGTVWERAVADGTVVGTLRLLPGDAEPTGLALAASATLLTPGTSQQLQVTLATPGGAVPLPRGVEWRLSDPTLADIDEQGVITARALTGVHSLTVTAHYRNGNLHLQDSLVLTLRELPPLASVDMSRLPARFAPVGTYALYTTLHVDPAAGGGTLYARGGDWSLVAPDAETQASVSIVASGGAAFLKVGRPARDLRVRLRAVQVLAGTETLTEQEVTVGQFTLQALRLVLRCPPTLEYGQALPCDAYVVNNDATTSIVVPALEVDAADASALAAVGDVLTSAWDNRQQSRTVTVTGRAGGLAATATVRLNPRKTRIASLELVGVSELAEGATAAYQAWANWDDGTRTNVTASPGGRFSSSDNAVASFSASGTYGGLLARYLLDETDDRAVTITATFCRLPAYYYADCPAGERTSTSAEVTVRYAPPRLTGLALDAGVLGSGFVAEGRTHDLVARATWNKKRLDGSAHSTLVSAGVEWTSHHPGAVVSGSQLAVGSAGDEPLLLVGARYADPADSANVKTARRVVTLYHAPVQAAPRLDFDDNPYHYDYVHLLGGDGLARPLDVPASPYPYQARVGAPLPYLSNVAQVMFQYDSWSYLRDDGSVWYPEEVRASGLPVEVQDQIVAQKTTSATLTYVPRRVPGLDNVVRLVPATLGSSAPGHLAALRADGTVAMIAVVSGASAYSYTVTPLADIADVVKIAGGGALYALRADGSVWSRGADVDGLGRPATANGTVGLPFGSVVKADGSPLTGIVDLSSNAGGGFALDAQGTIWAWGANESGQLGLGDNQYRSHAMPVTSVTGFSRLSPGNAAGLRSNGSLWQWASNDILGEPQRVADFTGLRSVHGSFAVAADGGVWWWGRYGSGGAPLHPQPVYSAGAPLVLP